MKLRVVAADNDAGLLEKIVRILKGMKDIELLGAFGNGLDTERFLKENQADAVFSDIFMDDISGIELASRLNGLPDPPKVVLMSDMPGIGQALRKKEVFAFVEKPCSQEKIKKALADIRKARYPETC